MARPNRLVAVALAAGSLVGTVVLRRRRRRHQTRVDLYFDDGSMLSLAEESPVAEALLPSAREILVGA